MNNTITDLTRNRDDALLAIVSDTGTVLVRWDMPNARVLSEPDGGFSLAYKLGDDYFSLNEFVGCLTPKAKFSGTINGTERVEGVTFSITPEAVEKIAKEALSDLPRIAPNKSSVVILAETLVIHTRRVINEMGLIVSNALH